MVTSSRRQTKPTHSLTASSSKGSNSSEASKFKAVKPQLPEIHIKPLPRNVKHFHLKNNRAVHYLQTSGIHLLPLHMIIQHKIVTT